MVLGCFFEGFDVDFYKVVEIVMDLLEFGVDEILFGDIMGMGIVLCMSVFF